MPDIDVFSGPTSQQTHAWRQMLSKTHAEGINTHVTGMGQFYVRPQLLTLAASESSASAKC